MDQTPFSAGHLEDITVFWREKTVGLQVQVIPNLLASVLEKSQAQNSLIQSC